MDNNEIKHFGVLGMRWGRRSGTSESSGGTRKPTRQEKRYAKDTTTASKRRSQTRKFLKELENEGEKRNWTPEKRKKEKEFWKNFLKDDLNATPESISAERRKTGRTLATAGLLIVGGIAMRHVINNAAKKYYSQKAINDAMNLINKTRPGGFIGPPRTDWMKGPGGGF